MSECDIFSAGNSLEINKIPDIFFQKRNLIIIKNLNDNKCLLYCYIRKHLNPIEKIFQGLVKRIYRFLKN